MTALAPIVRLLHGTEMPQLGLGTWPMKDAEAERVVADAISAGYRLIDTAEAYDNERGVGRGLKASDIARHEVFVTTKFQKRWHGVDLVREALDHSLERLDLDYVDLLLIHWPNPGHDRYVQAWEGMVQLLETGRVKAIGTSNFKPSHLDRIISATGHVPDVNQIQVSPALTRQSSRAYHRDHGIMTESYSPIGGRGTKVLHSPVIADIADEVDRTPAQVVLRWHLELGLITIPKSADPARLRENIAIFDFTLTAEQVAAISAIDKGQEAATDSDTFGH
jgi:2,5-diketo-D-gluconate reductase A